MELATIRGLTAGVAQTGSKSARSSKPAPQLTRRPAPEETAIPEPTLLLDIYAAIYYH
ncbi:hypothetical protein AERO9A_420030 [Aeromonas salmonicida]|nr:hypothetical protein AERO9A_420030 [Aeromonas salmonicida]